MSSNNSFHILLEAEQQASALVNEARQYRAQRLKDARREALEEIEELKKRKNEELIEHEKQHAGELEKNVIDYESVVEETLTTSTLQINQNRQSVLDLLLKSVEECEPKIHRNAELKLRVKRQQENTAKGSIY